MNFSIDLQKPMHFAVWPIVLVGCLLLAAVLFLVIRKLVENYKKKQAEKKRLEELKKKEPVVVKPSLQELKNTYLTKLAELETRFLGGQIESREAYTELSNLFRTFIYDATGTPAHKYTLYDMRGLDKPIVYNLVNNYYAPEFSKNEKGNVIESIDFTKRAIFEWN